MKSWIIDKDGDAVNLDHVATVQAMQRSHCEDWYVCAFALSGKGLALTDDMATQEDAVAWIAKHFAEAS